MDSEAFEAAEEPPVCCGGIESVLKKNWIRNFFGIFGIMHAALKKSKYIF